MTDLDGLLGRLEQALEAVEQLDDAARDEVFALLDGIDALHRLALRQLAAAIADPAELEQLRAAHPAVEWLFDAYAIGVDERAAAERALDEVRPYVDSHGGRIEVVDAAGGVVRLRLAGTCAGCTASSATLSEQVEEALREHWPGFVALEVEPDDATPHPPPPGVDDPRPTALVQIGPRPPGL